MPSSFVVRAKDSQGKPVMMVINPDSLTKVTEHTTEHQEAPLAGAIKGEPAVRSPRPLRSNDLGALLSALSNGLQATPVDGVGAPSKVPGNFRKAASNIEPISAPRERLLNS